MSAGFAFMSVSTRLPECLGGREIVRQGVLLAVAAVVVVVAVAVVVVVVVVCSCCSGCSSSSSNK